MRDVGYGICDVRCEIVGAWRAMPIEHRVIFCGFVFICQKELYEKTNVVFVCIYLLCWGYK